MSSAATSQTELRSNREAGDFRGGLAAVTRNPDVKYVQCCWHYWDYIDKAGKFVSVTFSNPPQISSITLSKLSLSAAVIYSLRKWQFFPRPDRCCAAK